MARKQHWTAEELREFMKSELTDLKSPLRMTLFSFASEMFNQGNKLIVKNLDELKNTINSAIEELKKEPPKTVAHSVSTPPVAICALCPNHSITQMPINVVVNIDGHTTTELRNMRLCGSCAQKLNLTNRTI